MNLWLSRRKQTLVGFWDGGFGDELFRAACCAPLLILIGYVATVLRPELGEQIYGYFASLVSSNGVAEVTDGALMMTLFENNLAASVSAMTDGLFPFLYLSALPLGFNLFIVGVFAAYYRQCGFGLGTYLVGILPHGVFELTALVISCAAGLAFCRAVTQKLRRRGEVSLLATMSGMVHVLWVAVIPLLLLAALIETYVTPMLLNAVW